MAIPAKIWPFVKWTLVLMALVWMYGYLKQNIRFYQLADIVAGSLRNGNSLLYSAILLMPMNWFLETLRWKTMADAGGRISWRNAAAGTLSGITVSTVMAFRMGEFAGRLVYMPPGRRRESLMLSAAGSWMQMICVMLFGVAGLLLLPASNDLLRWIWLPLSVLFFLVALVFLLFRFLPPSLSARAIPLLVILRRRDVKTWLKSSVITVLRFLVFSAQYVLIIAFFADLLMPEVPVSKAALFPAVWVIYLFQTVLPGTVFLEPGIRMVIPQWVLSLGFFGLSDPVIGMVAAAGGLFVYLLNIMVPALGGMVCILYARSPFRSKSK